MDTNTALDMFQKSSGLESFILYAREKLLTFAGKEGYYQRIKGTRSKRFVVKIDDFLACSAVLVECRYVKVER